MPILLALSLILLLLMFKLELAKLERPTLLIRAVLYAIRENIYIMPLQVKWLAINAIQMLIAMV